VASGSTSLASDFGALIESLPAAPGAVAPQIVVERAMYSGTMGPPWSAGTNAVGTPLR
jgi:hypothetical protein